MEITPKRVEDIESHIAKASILLLQNEIPQATNLAAFEVARKHGGRCARIFAEFTCIIVEPSSANIFKSGAWARGPRETNSAAYRHHLHQSKRGRICELNKKKLLPAAACSACNLLTLFFCVYMRDFELCMFQDYWENDQNTRRVQRGRSNDAYLWTSASFYNTRARGRARRPTTRKRERKHWASQSAKSDGDRHNGWFQKQKSWKYCSVQKNNTC